MKGNKRQQASVVLSGQVEDTLDLIMDEVNRGKRIIDNSSEVKRKNSSCTLPKGKFVFGVRLPDQAFKKEDYKAKISNKSDIGCPIVYTIRSSKKTEKKDWVLERFGPQYDDKGFYRRPESYSFSSSVLLEGIESGKNTDKLPRQVTRQHPRTARAGATTGALLVPGSSAVVGDPPSAAAATRPARVLIK